MGSLFDSGILTLCMATDFLDGVLQLKDRTNQKFPLLDHRLNIKRPELYQ
jgi:hypothetical protein